MGSTHVITKERLAEIKRLHDKRNGKLYPVDVVRQAENEASTLHACFEWDDTVCGEKYRLQQARALINQFTDIVYVRHKPMRIPLYTSFRSDRGPNDEGGYHFVPTIIKTQSGRDKLIDTALWELEMFERKYRMLKELVDVFKAVKRLRKKLKK